MENTRASAASHILRFFQSLTHAFNCRNANCQLPSCHKMKRVLQHSKICKRKEKGVCPICKQLQALCCYHAKYCHNSKCDVPFCATIKRKMEQHKREQRLQQIIISPERRARNSRIVYLHINVVFPYFIRTEMNLSSVQTARQTDRDVGFGRGGNCHVDLAQGCL
uniref:histone acetyltransferase n=1 Tax=Cacopsylla melanoneura TaxID=428564 RepID=A0A8D8XCB0_9HEMI